VKQIRSQVETPLDYDKEKLRSALPSWSAASASSSGAATETELKEKKARVEDAMHATRAAVEEVSSPAAARACPLHRRSREAQAPR